MIAIHVSAYLGFFGKAMHPPDSNQNGSYRMEGESSQKNSEKKVYVEFFVPQSVVGVIIGKGGSMIKKIEEQFKVKLFVDNIGEAQRLIGIYGPEDSVQQATETIMKLLLSLRTIQIKLDEMGKPRTLRYVEEITFLSVPKVGPPAWFFNLEKERIRLENGDMKIPKQTEAAKTDVEESHSDEVPRGRPMMKSPVPPINPEKSIKSKSKATPCLFKVKIVPRTSYGLPDDRYETEAIALSIRTPTNYGWVVGALRAGVENLPENFNLFMKIDNEWTKIPRPKNNENDAEIWNEYLVNQPKTGRILYLVEMPKLKKMNPEQEKFATKPAQKNTKTGDERSDDQLLRALMEKDGLEQDLELTQTLYERQKSNNKDLEQQLGNLKFELETVMEKFSRELTGQERQKLEQLEKKNQLLKEIIQCSVCYTLKEEVVFCGRCGHFTCCVECARSMTQLECPTCRARWSADLDGRMGKATNIFKDLVRFENGAKVTPPPRPFTPRTPQYPLNQTEAACVSRFQETQEAQSPPIPVFRRNLGLSSDLAPTPMSASQVSPPEPLRRSVTMTSNRPPLPVKPGRLPKVWPPPANDY